MVTKVLFITNILCRHQVGLWDHLAQFENIDFSYLCTRDPKKEISIRYKCDGPRNYAKYSSQLGNDEITKIINEADIIFYGSIEDSRIWPIIKDMENAYIISENYSKEDYYELRRLRGLRRKWSFKKNAKKRLNGINKSYVFCASSHTGEDFRLAGASKEATLKFGYFPHYRYANEKEINSKTAGSIVYIGRNVVWKHPELSLFFLNSIQKYDKSFFLAIYGENLDSYFTKKSNVKIHKSIPNQELVDELIKADIFIFPSDRREGWGVVLGEALASGCICFANSEAGSTNYLIKDKVNGFIYKNKSELKKKIRFFIKMTEKEKLKIRINAINTMREDWSGVVAANRIHNFIEQHTLGKPFIPYNDGPLSLD